MAVLTGYADIWGKHAASAIDHAGSTSYTTGGTTLRASLYGLRSFDFVGGNMTISGTYYVMGKAISKGSKTTYKMVWFVTATNAEVANGVNLSAETVRLLAIGG